MEIIVGTAGHIDHGKTALVRALTGTDADRLPEEKQRGITIDIGFAELTIGDVHFGFVDVPGHERFVKNMLAGASGIDIVVLVIAADEGVMPQTREHFEICRLLGIKQGIIVLTKTDLVDEETLELARMEIDELVSGSFLKDADVIPVSSSTGRGIEELKSSLVAISARVAKRSNERIAFLPIDRSFTLKGFGAVVTGTLASGSIAEGDELDLLPEGRRLRVRNVQTHGRAVKIATSGQRTAVNLAGIDHSSIVRGMALAEPDVLPASQVLDVSVEMLKDSPRPLRSRQRVRVHLGTAEILARVFVLNKNGSIEPGESGYVQLRLESVVACMSGDRFIIRSYSPQQTIGGGRVIMHSVEKHRRKDIDNVTKLLAELEGTKSENASMVRSLAIGSGRSGCTIARLRSQTGWTSSAAALAITAATDSGWIVNFDELLIDALRFAELKDAAIVELESFHKKEPLAPGMTRELLRDRVFRLIPTAAMAAVVRQLIGEGQIVADNDVIRLAGHKNELSPEEGEFIEKLMLSLKAARYQPPKIDEAINASSSKIDSEVAKKLIQLKLKGGELIKVTDDLYFAADPIIELTSAIRKYADTSSDRLIDVARFKEIAGVSRKYAIPLLEYFDRERVTVRAGDRRMILK